MRPALRVGRSYARADPAPAAAPVGRVLLAVAPCGCVKAAILNPEHDARAAEELAWARTRYTIRAVPTDVDWTTLNLRLECERCMET